MCPHWAWVHSKIALSKNDLTLCSVGLILKNIFIDSKLLISLESIITWQFRFYGSIIKGSWNKLESHFIFFRHFYSLLSWDSQYFVSAEQIFYNTLTKLVNLLFTLHIYPQNLQRFLLSFPTKQCQRKRISGALREFSF